MTSRDRRSALFANAVLVLAHLCSRTAPAESRDTSALTALYEGRLNDAQAFLHASLVEDPADPLAHQLLCRVFYAQGQSDAAIHECELAVASGSPDARTASDSEMWLGRAYGAKARHASPISAFALARKVRACFESAALRDPNNVAAASDLGEYYVDAPLIVGGGDDKARALATRLLPQFPSAAHRILGLLEQSHKNFGPAESEFKLAVGTARPHDARSLAEAQAEAYIDLAHFYQGENHPDDAVAAVHSALTLDRTLPPDRTHGPLLVDAASILTDAKREPALAERCLREYLASRARTDAAPVFKVHLQLARLLAGRGTSDDA